MHDKPRRFRLPAIAVLLALASTLAAGAAEAAERRVALVVGNSAYREMPLRNPAKDAAAIAAKLRALGFDVALERDAGQAAMRRAFAEFADRLGPDSTGLLFYAGHGLQMRGRNYLVPVDAAIASEARVVLESIELDVVLEQMAQSGARVNVAILDACRNNPFERGLRGASPGISQVVAPEGLLVAYATAPGRMAQDGEGANGLYTGALLRHIDQPGLKIEDVLKRARVDVIRLSGGAQVPWESSSLVGDFYLAGGAGTEATTSATTDFRPAPIAATVPRRAETQRKTTAALIVKQDGGGGPNAAGAGPGGGAGSGAGGGPGSGPR